MHGANLLGGQRLTEQINGRHLAAEDSLLVQLWRGSNVTLIKGLQRK